MILQRRNNIPDGIEIPNNNFLIYSENLDLQETIGQGKETNITLQKLQIYISFVCVIVVVVVVLLFFMQVNLVLYIKGTSTKMLQDE